MKKTITRMLGALCTVCLLTGCGSTIGEVTPKDVREDAETEITSVSAPG